MEHAYEQLISYIPEVPPPAEWAQQTGVEEPSKGFSVGEAGVTCVERCKATGDVYIRRANGPTLVHLRQGWAALSDGRSRP